MRRFLLGIALLLLATLVLLWGIGRGWFGSHEGPGEVTKVRIPEALVASRAATQAKDAHDAGISDPKQILFGDLHVHTTVSFDAFMLSLPLLQGEGTHPQADACDFARYCSSLDFWSINDHAEGFAPANWEETREAIRACNDVAGDPDNPDVVAYLGWEWTQVGDTPEDHYGHKNVVLRDLGDDQVPARAIAAGGRALRIATNPPSTAVRAAFVLGGRHDRYNDFARFVQDRSGFPFCEEDVPSPDLPEQCVEVAQTPGDLFRKLDEWGHESIVIPHGTTWGFYTPPGSSWDKQLKGANFDPDRQTLMEVFSGHGNSDEYRDFRAVSLVEKGPATCPEPTAEYLPTCWRAGEIIRSRCLAAGESEIECESRAVEARRNAAAAGAAAHLTVPGASFEEWLDSGQCRDCFQPAFNYRPGGSAQYVLALRNFDDPENPRRFHFGFMASSDNHTARPGTGFKERDRREMTEATGPPEGVDASFLRRPAEEMAPHSKVFDPDTTKLAGFQLAEAERQASFFLTGGLIAVHSTGRDRGSIWDGMQRREVYGTSGPRILLWFDLLAGKGEGEREERHPMGTALESSGTPRFEVRALGSFEQAEGCPEYSTGALSDERLHHLCRGECYNPTDRRRPITRIEVVRVRPQTRPDEPVAPLIEDPWRVFPCSGDGGGCQVRFEDPEFSSAARDAVYYVRAIEAPSPAVNAGNLRCERDASGECASIDPCHGDFRTDYEDDCLEESEERAWSSPIFVDYAG